MVLPACEFVVERSRLLQTPSVGQTRYMIKVIPSSGPNLGDGKYRFSTTAPRRIADNVQLTRGYLGPESPNETYACGRWTLSALSTTHATFTRVE